MHQTDRERKDRQRGLTKHRDTTSLACVPTTGILTEFYGRKGEGKMEQVEYQYAPENVDVHGDQDAHPRTPHNRGQKDGTADLERDGSLLGFEAPDHIVRDQVRENGEGRRRAAGDQDADHFIIIPELRVS